MKVFELIKAFILILPLGIFMTFTLMVIVNSTIKVRKVDALLRRVTGFYCGSASVASFMLMTYYYLPDWFSPLDVLYLLSVLLAMVLFYHFLHYATRPGVRFSRLHYVIPLLIFIVLLSFKLMLPAVWTQEGVRALLIIALLFGIVYSLLTLLGMQRYFIELTANQKKTHSMNMLQTVVYIVEAILFPVVFVFFPLVGGQTPGVLISSLLMVSILLALKSNIPLTYTMIRHYTSFETQNRSLFEELVPVEPPPASKSDVEKVDNYMQNTGASASEERVKEQLSGPQKAKKHSKPIKTLPPGFDKKMFNNFMRRSKPFLDPAITIADVAKALESNRTYVSEFVNKAYKMNFSSYINLCRLREMNRLLALPKNSGRTPAELIPKTGFGTMRNYLRTQRQFDARGRKIKSTENKID